MQHNHQDQHASHGEESSNNDADNTPRLTEVTQAKTERYHWGVAGGIGYPSALPSIASYIRQMDRSGACEAPC